MTFRNWVTAGNSRGGGATASAGWVAAGAVGDGGAPGSEVDCWQPAQTRNATRRPRTTGLRRMGTGQQIFPGENATGGLDKATELTYDERHSQDYHQRGVVKRKSASPHALHCF